MLYNNPSLWLHPSQRESYTVTQMWILNTLPVSNVKDKQGVVLSEKDQAERWVEHFKQVLNHLDPDETANIEPYSKTDFTLLLKF